MGLTSRRGSGLASRIRNSINAMSAGRPLARPGTATTASALPARTKQRKVETLKVYKFTAYWRKKGQARGVTRRDGVVIAGSVAKANALVKEELGSVALIRLGEVKGRVFVK